MPQYAVIDRPPALHAARHLLSAAGSADTGLGSTASGEIAPSCGVAVFANAVNRTTAITRCANLTACHMRILLAIEQEPLRLM